MSQSCTEHIRNHLPTPSSVLRLILTSLNGDNSWLISFPRPEADRTASGRAYFHVVSDPWLAGPADPGPSLRWILSLKLPHAPSFADGAAVDELVREIEGAASTAAAAAATGLAPDRAAADGKAPASAGVDAILVNVALIDHCHEPTLRTFRSSIPVFAIGPAAAIIRPWNHFDNVYEIPDLKSGAVDWGALRQQHQPSSLPAFLSLFRVCDGRHDQQRQVTTATVIVYSTSSTTPEGEEGSNSQEEALILAPHGLLPKTRNLLGEVLSATAVLAMLHAVHDSVTLWGVTRTAGADGGLALARAVGARYWVASHAQLPLYAGWLARFIREAPRTLESALEKEARRKGREEEEDKGPPPRMVRVENGGVFVLE